MTPISCNAIGNSSWPPTGCRQHAGNVYPDVTALTLLFSFAPSKRPLRRRPIWRCNAPVDWATVALPPLGVAVQLPLQRRELPANLATSFLGCYYGRKPSYAHKPLFTILQCPPASCAEPALTNSSSRGSPNMIKDDQKVAWPPSVTRSVRKRSWSPRAMLMGIAPM